MYHYISTKSYGPYVRYDIDNIVLITYYGVYYIITYLKRCLGSNYHCSLCRKVINWMALRSECSGLAANTASCKEKAEKARKCPDLTDDFDNCWAHMQTCTENEGIQDGFISRKTPETNQTHF